MERIEQFLKLNQFENAGWTANKIKDDVVRLKELTKIDIYEKYIALGKHRDAGIKFWENNMLSEAREQFSLFNDDGLIELLDACSNSEGGGALGVEIVDYYVDVGNNDIAKNVILETIKKDKENIKQMIENTKQNFKKAVK